jgi:hypothetical protein
MGGLEQGGGGQDREMYTTEGRRRRGGVGGGVEKRFRRDRVTPISNVAIGGNRKRGTGVGEQEQEWGSRWGGV